MTLKTHCRDWVRVGKPREPVFSPAETQCSPAFLFQQFTQILHFCFHPPAHTAGSSGERIELFYLSWNFFNIRLSPRTRSPRTKCCRNREPDIVRRTRAKIKRRRPSDPVLEPSLSADSVGTQPACLRANPLISAPGVVCFVPWVDGFLLLRRCVCLRVQSWVRVSVWLWLHMVCDPCLSTVECSVWVCTSGRVLDIKSSQGERHKGDRRKYLRVKMCAACL